MVKLLKKIQPDTKGRIALGKYSKNVDLFSMEINEIGQIILTPHVAVPISNPWLDEYPDEKTKVLTGITQAGKGKVHDLTNSIKQHKEGKTEKFDTVESALSALKL